MTEHLSIPGFLFFRKLFFVLLLSPVVAQFAIAESIDWGARPVELAVGLPAGNLRTQLTSCDVQSANRSDFSISHRGAPLGYAEHTEEGYRAAARMGAGLIECDVTFTKDRDLVCRHSQCDLHTTTNILETPLAAKCSVPPKDGSPAPFKSVKCCTSDLTTAEFKSLRGRMDAGDKKAKTVAKYLSAQPANRLPDSVAQGTLLTHRESIRLFKSLGVKMIPELKSPDVAMPFEGSFTQQDYAQAIVDDYRAENVDPKDVFLQSFNLDDVHYWLDNAPEFGSRAAWLDGRYRDKSFNIKDASSWSPDMTELAQSGVTILAPPMWMLLTIEGDQLVASEYAVAARAAGLDLIAWTLERSGDLSNGGGWYYQTVKPAIKTESDILAVLDVLAQKAQVSGVFSDWPATTTFYANCAGVE